MGKQFNKCLRLPDAVRTADSVAINTWSAMTFRKISSAILNSVCFVHMYWMCLLQIDIGRHKVDQIWIPYIYGIDTWIMNTLRPEKKGPPFFWHFQVNFPETKYGIFVWNIPSSVYGDYS